MVGALIGYHAASSSRESVEQVRASGPVFGEAHIARHRVTPWVVAVVCTGIAIHTTDTLGFASLVVCAWCLWWSVRIGLVDIDTHVITTTSVKRAAIGTGIILVAASVVESLLASSTRGADSSLVNVVLGAIVSVSVMKIVQCASRGDLGGGDVTVSAWLGMFAGSRNLDTVVMSIVWAFLCAGVVSMALIVVRRTTLRTHLAFGPFLILGTWIGVLR